MDPVFQWLGAAGFRIEHEGKVILIDPFLSRNDRARPVLDLRPEDMADADHIFISHGHFDHLADVPAIVQASEALVYCSEVAAGTLAGRGVPESRIVCLEEGDRVEPEGLSVEVFTCRHIVFDAKLILKTAPGVLREIRSLLPLVKGMPSGPVLVFFFGFGDLSVMHLGSLGLKPGDVRDKRIEPPDILALPLQGHSEICRLAAELALAIKPRAVVPQHHDDFFPPVSHSIDIEPFHRLITEWLPDCSYYEPEMNRRFTASDVFAQIGS